MYTINNTIKKQDFNGLQLGKLATVNGIEIITISLEKGAVFPEHTSPTDAELIVLEGSITFSINKTNYLVLKYQKFSFPKEIPHEVVANENSKFLIIR